MNELPNDGMTHVLATSITKAHLQVQAAVSQALTHAREAGRLLVEARAHIPHGGWIRFIEQDCQLSRSTAAGYVRVHERWGEIEPYVQRVAHLPLRQALSLLAEPKTVEALDASKGIDVPAGGAMMAEFWDRLALIHPSDDASFVFYNVMTSKDDGTATLDGGKRAIRRERVMGALSRCGFPIRDVTWKVSPDAQPWQYNELLYDSHDDYVKRGILGGDGFVDHPDILTSEAEHEAFIARCSETKPESGTSDQ
ncbi:MAG: DUF3102 domain-containing protein [Acidobacteriota bacterium]